MYTKSTTTLVLVMSGLLLGCERQPVTNTSQSPPPNISQTAPSAPAKVPDPSLPPVEAARLTPKSGTDATTGSALTPTERDSKMPLPGQANDHSSPEFAKRGDATAPVKSTK